MGFQSESGKYQDIVFMIYILLQLIVSQLLFTFSSTNSAYQAYCLILISSKFSLTWRMHCLASIAISFWNEQYHGTVGGL